MKTTITVDDELIGRAKEFGGFETGGEAVTAALEEFVRHHSQDGIVDLFGTIDYIEGFDPIAQRRWEVERHRAE